MKRAISSLLVVFLFLSIFSMSSVLAENENSSVDDTDNQNSTEEDSDNSGSDSDDDNETEIEEEDNIRDRLKDSLEEEFEIRKRIIEENLEIRKSIRERVGEDGEVRIRIREEIREANKERFEAERELIITRLKNRLELRVKNSSVETDLELEEELDDDNETSLRVVLSNGKYSLIKVMPDVASERALERLRLKVCSEENNCTIVLKEVREGNESKAVYEAMAKKRFKILGFINSNKYVLVQINPETGEEVLGKRPWWRFFASEEDETDSADDSDSDLDDEENETIDDEVEDNSTIIVDNLTNSTQ